MSHSLNVILLSFSLLFLLCFVSLSCFSFLSLLNFEKKKVFQEKFEYFVKNIEKMDELFSASFNRIEDTKGFLSFSLSFSSFFLFFLSLLSSSSFFSCSHSLLKLKTKQEDLLQCVGNVDII